MFGFGKNKIKISVITWDASFREYFHTVDAFGSQDYPKENYEFIWVDYYRNENPKLLQKIAHYPNARLLNLNRDKNEAWHLGRCINAGISQARGEILVIPDGDIVVPTTILNIVEREHVRNHQLVMYFRRWDEKEEKHDQKLSYDLAYLEKFCLLTYPTNYGGLLSIRKTNLALVNNYEESGIFSGPGANGIELYVRLRNKGFDIKWHNERIFHPYHKMTNYSQADKRILSKLVSKYPWINPYAGIEQSWVIRSREMGLSSQADSRTVTEYLSRMPRLEEDIEQAKRYV